MRTPLHSLVEHGRLYLTFITAYLCLSVLQFLLSLSLHPAHDELCYVIQRVISIYSESEQKCLSADIAFGTQMPLWTKYLKLVSQVSSLTRNIYQKIISSLESGSQ